MKNCFTKRKGIIERVIRKSGVTLPGLWVSVAAQLRFDHTTRAGAPHPWLMDLLNRFTPTTENEVPMKQCSDRLGSKLTVADIRHPQFLGTVLEAARSEGRKKRDSRHGRKSEPSVYTPWPLAQALVEDLPNNKSPVLDPACGAGIFLLAAFAHKFRDANSPITDPTQRAAQILSDQLIGIDLDAEALALCEFSLRMEAWEAASLDQDIELRLHCLDALSPLPTLEGSVEVVIGNPPYVEGRGLSASTLRSMRKRFRTAAKGKVNLFTLFIERGLELLRENGVLSLIVPATFTRNDRYQRLREMLIEYRIDSIVPVPPGTFDRHLVETVILRATKVRPHANAIVSLPAGKVAQHSLPVGPTMRFCINVTSEKREWINHMQEKGKPLETLFEVRDGISTGFQPFPKRLLGKVLDGTFMAEDGTHVIYDPDIHRRVIDGHEFAAFTPVHWEGRWIEHDKRHEHDPPHPGRPFNCQLREATLYDRTEKLLTRQTARGLIATVDRDRYFVRNSVHVTFPLATDEGQELSLDALCACLNSRLYQSYFLAVTGEDGGLYPQVHISDIRKLPVVPALLRRDGELHKRGARIMADIRAGDSPEADLNGVRDILERAFDLSVPITPDGPSARNNHRAIGYPMFPG